MIGICKPFGRHLSPADKVICKAFICISKGCGLRPPAEMKTCSRWAAAPNQQGIGRSEPAGTDDNSGDRKLRDGPPRFATSSLQPQPDDRRHRRHSGDFHGGRARPTTRLRKAEETQRHEGPERRRLRRDSRAYDTLALVPRDRRGFSPAVASSFVGQRRRPTPHRPCGLSDGGAGAIRPTNRRATTHFHSRLRAFVPEARRDAFATLQRLKKAGKLSV